MGPGFFVIAILGCADGGSGCTPVTTLQTRYSSEAECSAATIPVLEANSGFDFPTIVARCRSATAPTSVDAERLKPVPGAGRRG